MQKITKEQSELIHAVQASGLNAIIDALANNSSLESELLKILFIVVGEPDVKEENLIEEWENSVKRLEGFQKRALTFEVLYLNDVSKMANIRSDFFSFVFECKSTPFIYHELFTMLGCTLGSYVVIVSKAQKILSSDINYIMPLNIILWEDLSDFDPFYWLKKENDSTVYEKTQNAIRLRSHLRDIQIVALKLNQVDAQNKARISDLRKKQLDNSMDRLDNPLKEVKAKYQGKLIMFEKIMEERLAALIVYPKGKIYEEIGTVINELKNLETEKKVKKQVSKVPDEVIENIRVIFTAYMKDFYKHSLSVAENYFKELNKDIVNVLNLYEINYLPQKLSFNNPAVMDNLIIISNGEQNKFTGSIPEVGIMQLLQKARSGPMMVAMMLGMVGATASSSLRTHELFPVAMIIGMGFFGWFTYISSQKEKKENEQKNLEDAKKSIIDDAKSRLNDLKADIKSVLLAGIRAKVTERIQEADNKWEEFERTNRNLGRNQNKKIDEQIEMCRTTEQKVNELYKVISRAEDNAKKLKTEFSLI